MEGLIITLDVKLIDLERVMGWMVDGPQDYIVSPITIPTLNWDFLDLDWTRFD